MSDTTVLDSLRAVEFFHDFASDHLERLAGFARLVDIPAEQEMFHEHDPAKDVFVIISGQVSLVICRPKVGCRQLTQVGPGDLIGWSPLVGRERLSDTAYTLTPTKAVAIDGERVLALCQDDPEFGFEFMHRAAKVLAERLSATRLQLLDLSGLHLLGVRLESD